MVDIYLIRVDTGEKVEKEIGDKEYKLSRSCSGRREKGQQPKGAVGLWRTGETTSCLAAFRKDTVDLVMAKGEGRIVPHL